MRKKDTKTALIEALKSTAVFAFGLIGLLILFFGSLFVTVYATNPFINPQTQRGLQMGIGLILGVISTWFWLQFIGERFNI